MRHFMVGRYGSDSWLIKHHIKLKTRIANR